MNIIKIISLVGWAIFLLSIMSLSARKLVFRKKRSEEINLSESIYLSALLIAIAMVVSAVMPNLSIAYDSLAQLHRGKFVMPFVRTASIVSVCGFLLLMVSWFVSRFISMLFFNNRKDVIEFGSDNRSFALIRSILLLTITYILFLVTQDLFSYLLPSFAIPFYH
jgi:hypothetical protein